MVKLPRSVYLTPSKRYRRFFLLLCIRKNPCVTQKQLGHEAQLSSAMVNNYLKQLTKESLITISGHSNRDMSYHLTLEGASYVAGEFLTFSAEIVQFYATVRQEIAEILENCYNEGIRTVVLYGASDTAEIVYSAIQKTGITMTGVVDNDPSKAGKLFMGNVIQSPFRINEIRPDALLITSFARQNEILSSIEGKVDKAIQIKVIARI